jgi:hypothetical protein
MRYARTSGKTDLLSNRSISAPHKTTAAMENRSRSSPEGSFRLGKFDRWINPDGHCRNAVAESRASDPVPQQLPGQGLGMGQAVLFANGRRQLPRGVQP